MATTMKAAVVAQRGKALFEIKEVEVPSPGPGEILVRVESAGVNFSDVKRRRGDAYPFATEFPFIPGGEIAGTVEALGEGVQAPAVGTPVFALAGPNGFVVTRSLPWPQRRRHTPSRPDSAAMTLAC